MSKLIATVVWLGYNLRAIKLNYQGSQAPEFVFEENYLDSLGTISWRVVERLEDPESIFYRVMSTMKELT